MEERQNWTRLSAHVALTLIVTTHKLFPQKLYLSENLAILDYFYQFQVWFHLE